jgi:hypothetical protein
MGRRAGIDAISAMGRTLGFGEKFDLPVVSQSYGTMPSAEWKKARYEKSKRLVERPMDRVGHAQYLDRAGVRDREHAAARDHVGSHSVRPEHPAAAHRSQPRRCCTLPFPKSISTRFGAECGRL